MQLMIIIASCGMICKCKSSTCAFRRFTCISLHCNFISLTALLELHQTSSLAVLFSSFSRQICLSMLSQAASRPSIFWRKASPTASRRRPTTTTPAADLTPSSPSSTHRSSLADLRAAAVRYDTVNPQPGFGRFSSPPVLFFVFFLYFYSSGNPGEQPAFRNCQQDKPGRLGWKVGMETWK